MEHYDWNEGWLFTPRFDPALVRPECGLELEPVRIPHTVRVLPYNYCNENEYQYLCGYRREFFAPREWAGRTVLLTFGAVAHDATVFCNGRRLFHHACGYTAFTVDLTSALHLGVTGSVGKTTTKQMTYAALAGFGETIKTEGNQNNELGMPRTLMRLESSTEYAVIEMGMSHAGEIDRLARAARPDVGIITCIGVSHIGNLGSQENICKAKLEICNGLPEGAPLVLNYDDKFLRAAKLPAHVKPVWFSLADENADVCALSIRQEEDGMSFVLEDQEEGTFVVKIPAMGKHNVANALAAYCAATRLGCDPRGVIKGLSNFEQTGRRQKVVHSKGVTVIEDCYNANPDSMKAALAMFKEFPCKRRFALLGDMLELGELSREAHEELGRLAAESDLYCLVTYGENAKRTAVVAAAKGVKTLHANNYREAADALLNRIEPGDALLVKASRGMALEKVLEIFYAEQKDAEE